MHFDPSFIYHVSLEQEPCIIGPIHPDFYKSYGIKQADFDFTMHDLIKAVLYMGMKPGMVHATSRLAELEFKFAMVNAALDDEHIPKKPYNNRFVRMNSAFITNLDPTEKAAIHYWIGMVFATLLARKKFGYKHVIHYSLFKNDPINSVVLKNNTSKLSPDLICVKGHYEYGVFEAKGMDSIKSDTMYHAIRQLEQVKLVNGQKPADSIVSFTRTSTTGLLIRYRDPKEGEENIVFSLPAALIWQYTPLVKLQEELSEGYRISDYPLISELLPKGFTLNRSFAEKIKQAEQYKNPEEYAEFISGIHELPEMKFEWNLNG